MEKFIVTTGKTIDLAVTAALQQLGMDRDSVSVEVLENAKSGSVLTLTEYTASTSFQTARLPLISRTS